MQIAITGATGQLGQSLCTLLDNAAIPLPRKILDLTDCGAIKKILNSIRPDILINCAAYTAVDKAEQEPMLCYNVNSSAVNVLSQVCNDLGITLVQISTDYVFNVNGRMHPWTEDDECYATGVYAFSKRLSELFALRFSRNIVVRTCGLYTSDHKSRNFPNTITRIAANGGPLFVVNDQYCTPSYVNDVAAGIIWLCKTSTGGIYHITNSGSTTWYDFACEVLKCRKINATVTPIPSKGYPSLVKRPKYSVLDTTKYHLTGGPTMRHWYDSLSCALTQS